MSNLMQCATIEDFEGRYQDLLRRGALPYLLGTFGNVKHNFLHLCVILTTKIAFVRVHRSFKYLDDLHLGLS